MKKILLIVVIAVVAIVSYTTLMPIKEDETDSTCALLIECTELLENPEKLAEEKRALIPKDGIIYKNENVAFSEGETVDEILIRELKNSKIHIEFSKIPGYDTTYVEGIANLYQKDAGDLSGWLFYVNGKSSEVASSQYTVQSGDEIKWIYTCDFTITEQNAE